MTITCQVVSCEAFGAGSQLVDAPGGLRVEVQLCVRHTEAYFDAHFQAAGDTYGVWSARRDARGDGPHEPAQDQG